MRILSRKIILDVIGAKTATRHLTVVWRFGGDRAIRYYCVRSWGDPEIDCSGVHPWVVRSSTSAESWAKKAVRTVS